MNERKLPTIQGFLLDLDGVLFIEDELIPGAAETLRFLRSNDLPYRFMTNTTTTTPSRLVQKLDDFGVSAHEKEIISPLKVAVDYLRRHGCRSCHFVLLDEAKEAFAEFHESDNNPDYVVIGKIGDKWDYHLVNTVFNLLLNGAQLIALHKNRYSMGKDGLQIEFGSFVAALEYATGKESIVMGKPSSAFFESALASIGLAAEKVAMIGDDVESDVGGAQRMGINGILVQTGKYREELVAQSGVQPDRIISSIVDLPKLIEQGFA